MASNFIDARTDEVGSTIDASVCIIGSGAAGITLARDLGSKVPGTVLIESGGFELDGATQNLFSGKQLGLPYYDLTACRLRYWGGTTNHWSGYCRANDPIDYEGRPELGLPRWPISHADLATYIGRAAETLGINTDFFDPHRFLQQAGLDEGQLVDDRSELLETKVFQIASDIRLGPRFRDEIAALPNLKAYINLNAVHIQLAPGGRAVAQIDCATLTGKKVAIRAKVFVLACHAIENARLLLVSNDIANTGIGNHADHVGRYFMDHIHIFASRFVPSSNFPLLYNRQFADAKKLNANVGFSDKFLREEGLLQYYCRFNPRYIEGDLQESVNDAISGFYEPGSISYINDLAALMTDPVGVGQYVLAGRQGYFTQPRYFELEHRLEQAPNADSRVIVSDRKDALGSQIADLDWRINEHDVRSFQLGQDKMVNELSALDLGRVQIETITSDIVKSRVAGHYHQIGTTRMSTEPGDGVVNSDCRVHGIGNLYIGGSSVFPTAGYSGPTMMIIGFAHRIADHIQRQVPV
jgi:choline dehydrogenase-like flavoprotein